MSNVAAPPPTSKKSSTTSSNITATTTRSVSKLPASSKSSKRSPPPKSKHAGQTRNKPAIPAAIEGDESALSEAEIVELQEIFSLVDLDGGGSISKAELATLMRNLGLEASKAEMENLINEIDFRGTDEVDFETFVTAMSRKVDVNVPPEMLRWAFRKFASPSSNPGTILIKDIVFALTEFGEPSKRMSMEDAIVMMHQVAPELTMKDSFDYAAYIRVLTE